MKRNKIYVLVYHDCILNFPVNYFNINFREMSLKKGSLTSTDLMNIFERSALFSKYILYRHEYGYLILFLCFKSRGKAFALKD